MTKKACAYRRQCFAQYNYIQNDLHQVASITYEKYDIE